MNIDCKMVYQFNMDYQITQVTEMTTDITNFT